MRKHYLLFLMALTVSVVSAQTFSDDFEGYSSGDYIAQASEAWKTWGNSPGSSEDVKVVNTQSHSGSQSLYLSSTEGGPQDLVLPFGNTYNLGVFSLEMMLQVETGKGSYFNLQGEEKAGESWVLNFQSGTTGDFELYNDQEVLVRGKLSNGEWTKMQLVADLTYNRWSFYINEEMVGSWNNSVNTIGGLNLYPVNNMDENTGAGYWVDDVSYGYEEAELGGLNATLTNVHYDGIRLEGEELTVSADVRNLGEYDITSVELGYQYNGSTYAHTFSALDLSPTEVTTLTFNTPITLSATAEELRINLLEVNTVTGDDNNDDNSLAVVVTPIVPGANRMVVIEEGTGTWCGWCPRGAVALEQLEEKYGDFFQGIAIHSGDPMSAPLYTQQFVDAYVPGFPSGQLNRTQTLSMNPGASESAFLEALLAPAVTRMEVGATLTDGSLLIVSVTYTFSEAVNEQLRVACALVENGVTGTESGYAQSNYFANNANGEMFGWENKPSTVPASDMVYNDVARAISPSFRGSDMLPATLSAGESHTYQFTFELSDEWNTEEMHIVPLCFKADNSIENGASFTLTEAVENDLVEGDLIAGVTAPLAQNALQVYPNPATSQINVLSKEAGVLEVFNMAGSLVHTETINAAVQSLDVDDLELGVYNLRFTSSNGVANTSLVIK